MAAMLSDGARLNSRNSAVSFYSALRELSTKGRQKRRFLDILMPHVRASMAPVPQRTINTAPRARGSAAAMGLPPFTSIASISPL